MRTALITGITGQCGSYLAEFLLKKDYEVHGIIRRSSSINTSRIDHIFDDLRLHYGDLTDSDSLRDILEISQPDEIYNLGAQSHVRTSFDVPIYTSEATGLGALKLLNAAKKFGDIKFYQASSSELFGKVFDIPQSETTPFYPRSPYGVAKQFAYWSTVNYRERGMFACNGILFNNESPRRGSTFVTKKIVQAAVKISNGQQSKLVLGNIDARRDWGYSKEYVEAMHLMLQQPEPNDYVIATGEVHSVQDFLDEAFQYVGLVWQDYVEIDERYFRPTEVDLLVGDYSKAKKILGWEPKVKFKRLVEIMMEAEITGKENDD